jgi:hypothetical protein
MPVACSMRRSDQPSGPTRESLSSCRLQFFFPHKARNDDVVAADFLDGILTCRANFTEMPEAIKRVNSRVGVEIAHLSYARLEVTPEAKVWNVPAIHTAMMQLVRSFARHAPADRLAPNWRNNSDGRQNGVGRPHEHLSDGVTRVNTVSVNRLYSSTEVISGAPPMIAQL